MLGDDFVFLEELLRRFAEAPLVFLLRCGVEKTGAPLTAQFEIPILCELLRLSDVVPLRARTILFAVERSRALPERAVLALVDLDFAAENFVRRHPTPPVR